MVSLTISMLTIVHLGDLWVKKVSVNFLQLVHKNYK